MKKKIFLIIIIISVAGGIFLITTNRNNNKGFKLDTEYKYIIDSESKIPIMTSLAVDTYRNRYYEIDLEKNTIEVREDYVLNALKGEKQYTRKLINREILTDEEVNQLDILLKQVIQEGKKDRTAGEIKLDELNDYKNYYYLISNNEKTNIIMDDDEIIDKFLGIVKLKLYE